MDQLTGILLDMDAGHTNTLGVSLFIYNGVNITVFTQRNIKLRNLIRFGQIGIKVVFAVHLTDIIDTAMQRIAHAHGIVHHALIQGGQCTGHTSADGTAVGIDHGAEGVFASAVDLGLGIQLRMDFQTNDNFVFHVVSPSLHHSGYLAQAAAQGLEFLGNAQELLLREVRPNELHPDRHLMVHANGQRKRR